MFNPDGLATAFAPPQTASEQAAAPQSRPAGFEFPRWIWQAMLGAYGVFFAAMFAAFGSDGEALFMVVISALYALMYFGTARLLARIGGAEAPSPLERGGVLQCWTGPVETTAVAAQVLTVPACLAFFGVMVIIARAAALA